MVYDPQCNAEFNFRRLMKGWGKFSKKDVTDCVLFLCYTGYLGLINEKGFKWTALVWQFNDAGNNKTYLGYLGLDVKCSIYVFVRFGQKFRFFLTDFHRCLQYQT